MSLYHYLARLETILYNRQDIKVDLLQIDVFTVGVKFKSSVRFYDSSYLSIVEIVQPVNKRQFTRVSYKFHYQDKDGNLIFRYDNVPHYPNLNTFPDHKHEGDSVVESEAPDLSDILAEIDAIIYGNRTD